MFFSLMKDVNKEKIEITKKINVKNKPINSELKFNPKSEEIFP